jgi:septum formation protein
MVARLAQAKAEIVGLVNPDRWIIAADTTVAVDHHILGKPETEADAARMLMLIQGRSHQVHTGLCLWKNGEAHTLVDTAQVFLRPVTRAQAEWYATTGEPMDKAGGYAAQGIAALFIERIEGSFSTVMGFPVERLSELLRRLGLLGVWLGMP